MNKGNAAKENAAPEGHAVTVTNDELAVLRRLRELQSYGWGELSVTFRAGALVKREIRLTEGVNTPAADLSAFLSP